MFRISNRSMISSVSAYLWRSIMGSPGSVPCLRNNTLPISFRFVWAAISCISNRWILMWTENRWRYPMSITWRMLSDFISIDRVKEF